jgi:hypothetical protein
MPHVTASSSSGSALLRAESSSRNSHGTDTAALLSARFSCTRRPTDGQVARRGISNRVSAPVRKKLLREATALRRRDQQRNSGK